MIDIENTTVAEAYDVIEKLLHPKGFIINDNKIVSDAIINALNSVYRKGVADAEATHNENKKEIVTP